MATKVEAEHDEIRKGLRPEPIQESRFRRLPITDLASDYLAWGEAQGGRRGKPWGKDHARKRRRQIQWWIETLDLGILADVDTILPKVERALRDLQDVGRSGKTLDHYADSIRSFCAWCVDRQYLIKSPLARLKGFDTTPTTQRRALLPVEIRKLLNASPEHRGLLYETAFCTGLRAGELRALSVTDLDAVRGGVHLRAAWTKNRQDGFQPLPTGLVERLLELAKTEKIQSLYDRFYRRSDAKADIPKRPLLYVPSHPARDLAVDLEAARIPRVTIDGKVDFHACRVAYVTYVLQVGAGVKEAQSLARHNSPHLTMNTYARTRDERLSEIAEAVAKAVLLEDESTTCAEREIPQVITPDSEAEYSTQAQGSTPPASILQLVD